MAREARCVGARRAGEVGRQPVLLRGKPRAGQRRSVPGPSATRPALESSRRPSASMGCLRIKPGMPSPAATGPVHT